MTTKKCSKCKNILPTTTEYYHRDSNIKDGFRPDCKDCRRELRKRNRENIKNYELKKDFGITKEMYDILYEIQDGVCAICGKEEINKSLAVDHNHNNGKIRKLLCMKCNMMLGYIEKYKENPKKWDNYLENN